MTVGGPEAGTLLAPETVRRLACDATIIPTVLGVGGAVVDLGMDERLFTAAQAKRLWLRDRHCTYPGCDLPAMWCDPHRLVHWADDGPTDLSTRRCCASVTTWSCTPAGVPARSIEDDAGSRVEWDLTVGSYDRQLADLAARQPA